MLNQNWKQRRFWQRRAVRTPERQSAQATSKAQLQFLANCFDGLEKQSSYLYFLRYAADFPPSTHARAPVTQHARSIRMAMRRIFYINLTRKRAIDVSKVTRS